MINCFSYSVLAPIFVLPCIDRCPANVLPMCLYDGANICVLKLSLYFLTIPLMCKNISGISVTGKSEMVIR